MLEFDGVIVEFVPVETGDIFVIFNFLIEDGSFVFANHERLHRCVNIPVIQILFILTLSEFLNDCVPGF